MGKQMSKVGIGRRSWQHRRQRSSHEPTVVPSPAVNTALPHQFASESTDRAILTLKLQRDELTVYKGNAQALSRKEEEIIRRLVKAGRNERAKALLKKKRFQEQLIQETETQLNSVLHEAGVQVPDGMRKEVEQKIERNHEAIKKLHLLVALENLEKLVEDGDGSKKLGEVDKLLALASLKEQKELEEGADKDLQRLIGGGGSPKVVDTIPEQEEEAGAKLAENQDDDTEMLVVEKVKGVKKEDLVGLVVEAGAEKTPTADPQDLAHKGDVVVDTSEDEYAAAPGEQVPSTDLIRFDDIGSNDTAEEAGALEVMMSTTQSIVSSLSELNAAEDADDEKSSEGGPSETQSEMPLSSNSAPPDNLSSSLLPDVPTHSIEVAGEDGIVADAEAEKQGVAGDVVQAAALTADQQ